MYSVGLRFCRALGLFNRKNVSYLIAFLSLAILEGLSDGLGVAMATTFITHLMSEPGAVLELFRTTYPMLPSFIFASERNLAIFIVAMMFVRIVILVVSANLRCILPQTMLFEIRHKMTRNLLGASLQDLEKERSGRFLNLVFVDSVKASLFIFNLVEILYVLAVSLSYVALLFGVNPKLTLIGLVAALPFGLLLRAGLRKIYSLSQELLNVRNALSSNYAEKMNQLRFIKAAGTEEHEIDNLKKDLAGYRDIEIRRFFIQYFSALIPQLLVVTGVAAMFLLLLHDGGAYRPYFMQEILPMVLIAMRGFGNFTKLNSALITAKQDQVSALAIERVLQNGVQELANESAQEGPIRSVVLDQVSFAYDGRTVLNGFNLALEPGVPVILRGPSGRGKTTVANLVRSLSRAQKGAVLYNGLPADEFGASNLKKRIAYATQVPTLFYNTVRNNLIYGLDQEVQSEKSSDDFLWNVLRRANAEDFVRQMPKGMDSLVLEKGANLSEGQKQRLNLARLLVLDSDVFIFDEITSGLDPDSRNSIVKTIRELAKDKICLLITHDSELRIEGAKEVMMQ